MFKMVPPKNGLPIGRTRIHGDDIITTPFIFPGKNNAG